MKKLIFFLGLYTAISLGSFSQFNDPELALLQKMDSVKRCPTIARHFASLYFETTSGAVEFFLKEDGSVKDFIDRLETGFADYFFRSAAAYSCGAEIPIVWKAYFTDTTLSPLQYQLLGINAHINGDIWQALTTGFSLQEIQEHKKSYFDFQKGLVKEYRRFYDAVIYSNSKTGMLHGLTLGLDKIYGRIMMARWRKRQMNLAILYFKDHDQFAEKLEKLQQKMSHLNYLILRNL